MVRHARETADTVEQHSVDMPFHIQPMSASDIPAAVSLQVAFLNGSVLTQLGPRFLTRFHAAALTHQQSRAFIATDDGGTVMGFALGSLDVHGFNAHVKPRVLGAMALALLSPSRVTLAPSLARMVVEGEPQPPIPAELLLLVVAPAVRRGGVGRSLIGALERAFAIGGTTQYRVAVRSQLAVARAFYEALGFAHEQERSVLGQPMLYLTKQVKAS